MAVSGVQIGATSLGEGAKQPGLRSTASREVGLLSESLLLAPEHRFGLDRFAPKRCTGNFTRAVEPPG